MPGCWKVESFLASFVWPVDTELVNSRSARYAVTTGGLQRYAVPTAALEVGVNVAEERLVPTDLLFLVTTVATIVFAVAHLIKWNADSVLTREGLLVDP